VDDVDPRHEARAIEDEGVAAGPERPRVCERGEWDVRMVVETVLSMLTRVCRLQQVSHRAWSYFEARLAYTMALSNVLVSWHGLEPDEVGFVPLSIAEFSL
jgi:hypothetical protein